jgi:hypothetical protein
MHIGDKKGCIIGVGRDTGVQFAPAYICVKGSTIVFKTDAASMNVFTGRTVCMPKWPEGLAKTMGATECVKA